MKVLVVHNRYQIPGGEDAVVEQEVAMLRANGIAVETFLVSNDAIVTTAEKIKTAAQVIYSWEMRKRISETLNYFQPDVMHVHNTFPLLSPSIYDAARDLHCPVVQTIHNFRLVCLKGTLYRDGKVCLACVDRALPWPGVEHRCYRSSLAGSASVALMLAANRLRGAWTDRVDRFLVLTPFARDFFLKHTGIAVEKMRIKPNAAEDAGLGEHQGGYALFVGRLSGEKGISSLLDAARQGLGLPLKIAGQGPLATLVQAAHDAGLVEYLGAQTTEQVRALMQDAAFLLVPSLWYEGLPMVIPEAFATGLPVIASEIGSLASLIDDQRTGLLIPPGDGAALAAASRWLVEDAQLLGSMRLAARCEYVRAYLTETNFRLLSSIYNELLPATQPPRQPCFEQQGTDA